MTLQSTIVHTGENLQTDFQNPKYKAYGLNNYRQIPQINRLTNEQIFDLEVVARVLPFRTNNYVIDELIDWENIPIDPLYILNFLQKGMLKNHHFDRIAALMESGADEELVSQVANQIRDELDPHPAGQISKNRPTFKGNLLPGVQHKYRETMLFFPTQGQTCHAYCTFCFRWPQFIGRKDYKFAMSEIKPVIKYIRKHPDVTDILFTGGDPLFMKTKILEGYIDALLQADLPNLRSIRIGSKTLSYWPYRFLTDSDADALLALFEKITSSGIHLAIMAHFNHLRELSTTAVELAISRIRQTGAQIRAQSPVLNHINNDPDLWASMWQREVELGIIPYYMFIARNTGAQHYFSISLEKAWKTFGKAYQQVSGLARTVRGPVMSCNPGKIQVLGVSEIKDEKVFVLRALQHRNPKHVMKPFYAQYDPQAIWFNQLKPAFGEEEFFFE